MTPFAVSVRALCEFAAKQGDLDLRFTPSPTAEQGVAGHQAVAARRGATHRSEVTLTGHYGQLLVRGRADGYDPQRGRLEEVKTFKGELARLPPNHRALHWAQVKVYGWLACAQFDLPRLRVALVYYDVGRQQEAAPLEQDCTAVELRHHFEGLCERFVGWAEQEQTHRAQRDLELRALTFAHPQFRAGQHTLARQVFHAARHGAHLMAQAPTGIGKTLATLFPMLRACPEQSLDKIFFLTAKGSGRTLALDALAALRVPGARSSWRVLELVARDRACVHPDKACHGESCPLARGFYDRLPPAREAAAGIATLDREALQRVAQVHAVCPYYLGQEMVRWCDVAIGDYNHYLDSSALLHGLTLAHGWRAAVLVDEAHNLVERGREMYTVALRGQSFTEARRRAPASLKRPLQRLQRAWRALDQDQTTDHAVRDDMPRAWVGALRAAVSALGEALGEAEGRADLTDPQLLAFYFDALAMLRLLDTFGAHSIFDVSRAAPSPCDAHRPALATPCVRNVVPGVFLAPRWARAHAVVLFSATLSPPQFYLDMLGLPAHTAWLDVPAPFHAAQLSVRVVRHVSTRYADRAASLEPMAELMARQFHAQPGNYLAFFSSFEYLRQAVAVLRERHPDVPVWEQSRGMDEPARSAFLARFSPHGQGIGYAVLGGSFAEGIDLPGRRLIGAFVATLGLPQVNPVNEALRRRLSADFSAGYEYTYLYPGLRKVVQAAGRVIRTLSDRGTVHLIDDRYAARQVQALLPTWWCIEWLDAVDAAPALGPRAAQT